MRIIGNQALLSQIQEIMQQGRLMHACMISGPRGSGKKTLARYLAAAAVCTGAEPPCGHCEGCVKAEKEIHPDIDRIQRERGEITIDQVRSLRASLFTVANEAPRKVCIVEEADRMNRNAQNALLTVLEEPPSAVLLILLAENETELLPTIRSRCVHFRMSPLSEKQVIEALMEREQGISYEKARMAARQSEGILGRALELVNSSEKRYASKLVRALASNNRLAFVRTALALDHMKREQIAEELEEIRRILTGAAAVIHQKKEYEPTEEEKLLSERINSREILRFSRECTRLIDYCDANVGIGHITGALISLFSEEHDE